MSNSIKPKKIKIVADRESVCAADDVNDHSNTFEINESLKMFALIENLQTHSEYFACEGGIWAGDYDHFKCIKDNQGNWRIDKNTRVKAFFTDIEKYIRFERNSKRCQ